jgi:hypothetical protein
LNIKMEQIETKIDYIETKINKLVYHFCELTEEQIKIVEGTK